MDGMGTLELSNGVSIRWQKLTGTAADEQSMELPRSVTAFQVISGGRAAYGETLTEAVITLLNRMAWV